MKKIRLKYKGKWSKWYDFDKAQIKQDVEAVETKETMTLLELKTYPDLYEKAKMSSIFCHNVDCIIPGEHPSHPL